MKKKYGKKYSNVLLNTQKNKKILKYKKSRENLKVLSMDSLEKMYALSARKSLSICRIKRRCLMTNKSRGIMQFGMSRIAIRLLASNGFMPGAKKS